MDAPATIRRSKAKYKVRSCARQAFLAAALVASTLSTIAAAVTQEMNEVFYQPIKDVADVFNVSLGHERAACLEVFAGWGEITLNFAEKDQTCSNLET